MAEALALVVITFIALTLANTAWSGWGAAGIATSEIIGVLLPTVAWLAWRRPPRATLGLASPIFGRRGAPTLGALVAGLGAFYVVAVALEPLMERVIPTPPALKRALEQLIAPPSGLRPLPLDLLAFALVPAVAEELLFRGVLFGALRDKLPAWAAVLVSAIAFAAYHGSLPHLLPALAGGLLLGLVRAVSRRLAPAIAFHFANNAAVVLALR
ncbi:MAG TPA: type II CAAX endopeptidase family protein, partial [Polyangia bacterium]|nr:type II CAAX endopeptidase family protein [Polyangia bacterium]